MICLPGPGMPEARRFSLRFPPAVRWALTVALLVALAWTLDIDKLIDELTRFSAPAVMLALVVSVAQVVLSAWRWRFTAGRLGLGLAMSAAIREYYLATFLNQCLPGGVLGDVNRAWRHGSDSGEGRLSLHAVMIERLSGQLVMCAVALVAGFWLATMHPQFSALGGEWGSGAWVFAASVAAVVFALAMGGRLWRQLKNYLASLGRDIYRGLLNPAVLPVQLLSSVFVVATYLAVFWLLSASAYGNPDIFHIVTLLALCSLLLLAMVIPVTVAGWGVRESAAAVLWPLAGMPAEQGVALSVGYGLTVLLSSLPGSLWVFSRPLSQSGADD